jgi:hypothetical protein
MAGTYSTFIRPYRSDAFASSARQTLVVEFRGRAPCMADRDELIGTMQRYLDAMTGRDAGALRVSEGMKVTENGVAVAFGEGLFRSVQRIGFRQCFADPNNGQAGCFGTLETAAGTLMLALRLQVQDGLITESEAIIPRKGGHRLFAPEQLLEPLPIYDSVL